MNRFILKKAASALRSGGVIAYPTEAVFGLGCDPMDENAALKLLALKNRPLHKGLILVAANFAQLEPYLATLSPQLFDKVMQSWPGPINWLLPANLASPKYLRGKFQLQAVRVSNHSAVQYLCEEFGGAIVSTSANVSRRPAATTAIQTRAYFTNQLDYVVNGLVGDNKTPCEIRNGLTDSIIRTGK